MNDEVPDQLNAPKSRAAMAKEADVATTTLRLWSEREDAPLLTVQAPSGRSMYTWFHLRDFCLANPTLTATPRALVRYRELFVDPADGTTQQDPNVGPDRPIRSRPTSSGAVLSDGATLRSVLADLKSQVLEHDAVVTAATKLAQDAARIQVGLLARVELLELAVAGATEAGS